MGEYTYGIAKLTWLATPFGNVEPGLMSVPALFGTDPPSAWSVWLRIPIADMLPPSEAPLTLLVANAAVSVIVPGRSLTLYAGREAIAKGEIVSVHTVGYEALTRVFGTNRIPDSGNVGDRG